MCKSFWGILYSVDQFREENNMRMLDNENQSLEDAGFQDEDSLLAEIRSR